MKSTTKRCLKRVKARIITRTAKTMLRMTSKITPRRSLGTSKKATERIKVILTTTIIRVYAAKLIISLINRLKLVEILQMLKYTDLAAVASF